ncbi:RNA 2'-phosphotransferase [uncultured Clostridium sp.]|jgi:putative RNA 2'-phosphotransferase|uniref:RNA 2'-phosphotransferase n=1 Tax=uncultured Clostridium sp. TaxID=59620 RepID=UPI002633BC4C|nr:RNA 2'-phosphotransferase [uncultured Clostridium sp.]
MNNKLSVFISLVLRHKPEAANIKLDERGYANVDELIKGMNSVKRKIDFEMLDEIVKNDNKSRYSFNEDKTKIRANQGHSIDVDVELEECIPPSVLYHGTATRFVDSIMSKGIIRGNRLYVHLSKEIDTASKVGTRHGELALLQVDSDKMYREGYKFYISKNNVWLTDFVPVEYVSKMEEV